MVQSGIMNRLSISFDNDDMELLKKQIALKNYDSYADAIRRAVRTTFGNQGAIKT
jgi:Arc/MetJ-type ribon-helix-helix transcriptional regulator